MTHRGVATSARFLTGHSREGGEEQLAGQLGGAGTEAHTTLIVYMGLQVTSTAVWGGMGRGQRRGSTLGVRSIT